MNHDHRPKIFIDYMPRDRGAFESRDLGLDAEWLW